MKREFKLGNFLLTMTINLIGTFLIAFALNYFFAPNMIAPGGVTGFGVVIETLTGLPIWVTNFVVNGILFIIGLKVLGKDNIKNTIFSVIFLTLWLKYIPTKQATSDMLLASLFGGVLTGLGLGLVFRRGGTTGGTDLLGAILNKTVPGLSIPSAILFLDALVVSFAGIVDKKVETTLYCCIAVFVTVKVIDFILEGMGYMKAFYIVTEKPDEIAKAIMEKLTRGVTALKGKGMYTKADREVLLCVVSRAQFGYVKEIVNEIDPKAFVMVTETYEVIGEGFKPRSI